MECDLGKVYALRRAFARGTNQSHPDVLVSGSTVILNGNNTSRYSYPLVYIVVVSYSLFRCSIEHLFSKKQALPISGAHLSEFCGNAVPFAVIACADVLFALSGLFNTTLFMVTRPRLIPRNSSRCVHLIHTAVSPRE